MYRTFEKDKQIVDKYIDNYHIHKNDIYLLRFKLSYAENPKDFLEEFFNKISSGNIVVITETIVYDEDSYLNTVASNFDENHRRFFTINEILEFISEYSRLNYFLNYSEEVEISSLLNDMGKSSEKEHILSMLNDFPEDIQNLLHIEKENGEIVSFHPNVAVFICTRK